ncbi:MAG: SPFH domain-containing protein [Cyclobacteriaceae bacterium]|jgi:regulator of protease activity HflC (stomatin/prohibitin superfamily)|nr:SPFH domain-containing protein [Cyclobacteriaceae bacterium]MDH4297679.1 SPFH domain-containing protein [Cyclobacteriaceae bacterium]MDH5250255.1 SPFH domain-containing protein [Cyclobacteriaceae bacterium]
MHNEKNNSPMSGYLMAIVVGTCLITGIGGFIAIHAPFFIFPMILGGLLIPGFFYVNPNSSVVLVLFGDYKGTVKTNGFFWVNPLFVKKPISLRARNFDSEKIKVNDKVGNPIQIGVILVWQVRDTFKAAFEVDNYENFVRIQSDSAVRKLAGLYPYDNFDTDAELTLRSGHEEVNRALEENLKNRLDIAGIHVIEARIGYLAYAPEIASAMLRRQQATAVVAARFKIVEGAISMVQMALSQLSEHDIIDLDDERKAAMVSNLMVVLCSDKDVSPVVNTGTLNH